MKIQNGAVNEIFRLKNDVNVLDLQPCAVRAKIGFDWLVLANHGSSFLRWRALELILLSVYTRRSHGASGYVVFYDLSSYLKFSVSDYALPLLRNM